MGQYAGIMNQLSSRRTNNDIAVVAQRDARRKEIFASLLEFSFV